jgi:hypothetical protein
MAGLFYAVDLSRDEQLARSPRHVEKFLVELCEEHGGVNTRDVDRQGSATAVAFEALENRYTPEAVSGTVGYVLANRYTDTIPSNLGQPHFTDACGCRAWKI